LLDGVNSSIVYTIRKLDEVVWVDNGVQLLDHVEFGKWGFA
jgi:hypothetical protein